VYAVPGKGAETIDAVAIHLQDNGCKKPRSSGPVSMGSLLSSSILHNFKKASITFDKFDVVKLIKEGMDKMRNSCERNSRSSKATSTP
jgi:hypothetical protein